MADIGRLQVSLVSAQTERPIEGATVEISQTGEPEQILEVLTTDSSGQTDTSESILFEQLINTLHADAKHRRDFIRRVTFAFNAGALHCSLNFWYFHHCKSPHAAI